LPTITFSGVAVEDEIPALVGTAVAVSVTAPLADGRHVQVTEKLDPEPLAVLFLHPGIITFLALKVTLEATLTFAVIVTTPRYVRAPVNENELNEEVSTTSVTVIVIVWVLAFPKVSVAVNPRS
jgi:hypothetical protein